MPKSLKSRFALRKRRLGEGALVLAFCLLFASVTFGQLVLTQLPNNGVVQAPIDVNGWRSFKLTLTQNVTSFSFLIILPPPPQTVVTVEFVENNVGSFTVAFASSISNPCVLNTAANAITTCQFIFDSTTTTWLGLNIGSVPTWQNQGTSLGAPTSINCSTNLTCTFGSNTVTIVASSSAATAFSGITAATNSNAGTFAASGNTWDFSAATSFKLPVAAGAVPTASGLAAYDSTNNKWVFGQNGATVGFGLTSSACAANTFVNTPATSTAAASCAQPAFSNLSGSIALAQTPLTTRGDVLVVTSGPALSRLGLGSSGSYLRSNGTDIVYSTIQAADVPTLNQNTSGTSAGLSLPSGTATMGTSAIASGACATVVTVTATGLTTATGTFSVSFNGDPTAVTGYGASATGAVLTIYPYPTAGNLNFKVCNSTASSITPGALTLNWQVTHL